MDEWSKPVKMPEGWQSVLGAESKANFYPPTASLRDGLGVLIISDAGAYAAFAPREVVLRLLAAEASDRLGWVWEVDTGEWIVSSGKSMWGRHAETGEPITYDDHFGFTADELVASLMGRFLLEDALREAGR